VWRDLFSRGAPDAASNALATLLHRFSIYGIPAAIAAFSLIAVFHWTDYYAADEGRQLALRTIAEDRTALAPAEALAALSGRPAVTHLDTRLAETPFWFTVALAAGVAGADMRLEFPSRHATAITCWDAASLARLGSGGRAAEDGGMRRIKAGFDLGLGRLDAPRTVLCKATYSGPARISAWLWAGTDLDKSISRFHRESGLLEGGLIVLGVFVLLTAVINREWLYVLFAAWLVVNLRMAALSAGWDTQWIGRAIAPEWMPAVRRFTIAGYYVLTFALFTRLFADELGRVGYRWLQRLALWSCPPILLAALLLPYARFLPYVWISTALGVAVLSFFIVRIIVVRRSTVAMWYGASIAIMLAASLYEVLSAALGFRALIGSINSATAALASSLMAALAISEQMRVERSGRVRAEDELRVTYEAIPVGLFTLEATGSFVRCNSALREMLGLAAEADILGRRWAECLESDSWQRLQAAVHEQGAHEIELSGATEPDVEPKRFLARVRQQDSGRIEGSLQDITERAKAIERLRFLAENDPLTGVLNRRGIEKRIAEAVADLGEGALLAFAYLDLDRFKLINDLFGHTTGDEVLRQVCGRIESRLDPGHCLGRVGGDEFVVVFRDTPLAAATMICRGIVGDIENAPYRIGEKAFQVKGSIGLVEVADSAVARDVISLADRACRQAKSGSDGLVVYSRDAAAFRERSEELRLVERFGIDRVPDGLFLEYQPIMSLRTPFDSLNFEALIRLREADGTITPASKIIAAAEHNGRIAAIDRWVMSTALAWLAEHRSRLAKTRFVCINLSGGSLNDERFVHDALAILREHGRVADRICFEITEGVALHDLENTRRFIDRVREFGAKVALDDFGAGYTSFAYLKQLPADAVKIDGSFVRDVAAHPANLSIVQGIAELARNLGMQSIAEWVEDVMALEALADVGVDYAQGYVIAMPMAPAAILAADSAASLIEDARTASFVRDVLATGRNVWAARAEPVPPARH